MRVHLAKEVPGVDPREAAAWWSDFREGHTDHAFLPGARRRIVERAPDHVTMQEEALGLPWEVVTAWPADDHVRFAGRNRLSRFEGTYRFEPFDGGVRVVLDADIHLARGLKWASFAARPLVEAILRVDLAGHAKELQKDLRPDRQNPI